MKKLVRSKKNRMLAGICGGIGEYFQVDATLIRLLMVLSVFVFAGTPLIIYVIAMFIIPLEDGG